MSNTLLHGLEQAVLWLLGLSTVYGGDQVVYNISSFYFIVQRFSK